MPTESDTASTVKLQVELPTKTPLASVSVRPIPGWTATTTTTHLAQPIKTDGGTPSQTPSRRSRGGAGQPEPQHPAPTIS